MQWKYNILQYCVHVRQPKKVFMCLKINCSTQAQPIKNYSFRCNWAGAKKTMRETLKNFAWVSMCHVLKSPAPKCWRQFDPVLICRSTTPASAKTASLIRQHLKVDTDTSLNIHILLVLTELFCWFLEWRQLWVHGARLRSIEHRHILIVVVLLFQRLQFQLVVWHGY